MAFSLIASVSAGSSDGSNVTTGSITTTGADLIIVAVGSHPGSTYTVSDSKGNTYVTDVGPFGTQPVSAIHRCFSPTSGTGHTFTVAGSSSFPSLYVIALSGADTTAGSNDQENGGGSFNTSTVQAGSVTPTTDNQLIIAAMGYAGTSTPAIDGGFTRQEFVAFAGSQHWGGGVGYLIQTTAAAANPTWSNGDSGFGGATIATYKAAAGGGGPTPESSPPTFAVFGPGAFGTPDAWQWIQQFGPDEIVSADVSTAGLLYVGVDLRSDVTRDTDVTGRIFGGFDLRSTVSHEVSTVGQLFSAPVPISTTTHELPTTGQVSVGPVPISTTTHELPVAVPIGVGVEPYATVSHNMTLASAVWFGSAEYVSAFSHDANVAAPLYVGESVAATVTHNSSATGLLPVGVVPYALVGSIVDVITSGIATVGVSTQATVTRTASVGGIILVGETVAANVSKNLSIAGYIVVGVRISQTPAGGGFNICFEVAAPVFLDRAATLAMVARLAGVPSMVERSLGPPGIQDREASLEMVDRSADVALVDRSAQLEMVDRTATVEMVDREPGDPKISCEE